MVKQLQFAHEKLMKAARRERPAFEQLCRDVPFEPLGILYSEALFVRAVLDNWTPGRILESGRARGQSTLLLARAFPNVPIISVEINSNSPNVAVADERLRRYPNVELLYGDARRLLPRLTRSGDVVVIDGPKGYRGLKLALSLLATARPAAVFMHDCHVGSEERTFLSSHVPNVHFSDDPEFEAAHASLDTRCFESKGGNGLGWRPHFYRGQPQVSYGPTYACLLMTDAIPYGSLVRRAVAGGILANLRRSVQKRIGRNRR